MIKSFFFVEENKIKKNAEIWNAVFSILNAGQSALLIFLIAHFCGDTDTGIFSLAFSVAYLMIMIGNYGVRNYHATDIVQRYASGDYILHRIICCSSMLILSVIYILMHDYNDKKAYIIFLCCILKLIESIEDVIHGEYQRCGRLDVAGKIGTVRYIACMLVFIVTLVISKDLVLAFLFMDIASALVLIFLTLYTYSKVINKTDKASRGWFGIFATCFPLFLSTFFNIYICNASKYAIDKYYNDEVQGYYGMLFMPVFVINLLCICIYRPKLVELAEYWNKGDVDKLKTYFRRQLIIVFMIGAIIILFSAFIGTQVLSIFYGIDLNAYRIQFLVLLIGGTMTAIVDFCNNMITIIRKQKFLLWIYGIIFALAFVFTGLIVKKMMLMGAAISYSGLLCVQAVLMVGCFVVICKKEESENDLRNKLV